MSSFTPPPRAYLSRLGREERTWLGFAVVWCLILFALMYVWQAYGAQTTPIESYRIEPSEFRTLADRYVEEHRVGEEAGVPIAVPNEDGEAYLVARAFRFDPILRIRTGETVRIYLSSLDVQHGLSIQPSNLNFQVLPGYVYVVTLTPEKPGEYGLVCNEYCGAGHHLMTGRIVVVD
ncbi:MAG: hypothetical protein WD336_05415 [Trueperaceae bacterium]